MLSFTASLEQSNHLSYHGKLVINIPRNTAEIKTVEIRMSIQDLNKSCRNNLHELLDVTGDADDDSNRFEMESSPPIGSSGRADP